MKSAFPDYGSQLKKELEKLPPMHRIAFGSACCERLLPTYNAFSRSANWGDPSVPRMALDEVWQVLQGKPVNPDKFNQLREEIEDICPDLEESNECINSEYVYEAQDAIFAIDRALLACLEPSGNEVYYLAKGAAGSVELSVTETDESILALRHGPKEKEAIANHPWLVRELAKQSEDLQRLQETPTLDRDFLEWLRTSFDNDGKSNIDAS